MALAPIHRLPIKELKWLAARRCKHGHSYIEHYGCYIQENPKRERIGYLDIETTGLDANFGVMISYCIKEDGGKVLGRAVTKDELDKFEDKKLVADCIKDILKFDHIVTYYGARFDVPFLRTRALIDGLEFPFFGSVKHTDAYFMARNRLKLNSNRLENVARLLLGKANKTRLDETVWRKAGRGDSKSLGYVLDHNQKDVIETERVYKKLRDFVGVSGRSI